MRDLFELATLVGQAFAQGEDFGEAKWLQQFEQHRQADQARIMQSTSGLISLFSCNLLPVQIARNLALIGVSHLPIARQAIAHRALGWS